MTFALRAWVLCCLLLSVTACGKQSDTVVAIAPHPRNPDILYVATNESLYKTRDGGATWSKMTTDLSSFRILTLGVDPTALRTSWPAPWGTPCTRALTAAKAGL